MWFSYSLDPKDSKKSKFDHLEGLLVVLARDSKGEGTYGFAYDC